MIGQTKNIEIIKKWRIKKAIPRFIMIEGEEGSGRLTLAKKIAQMLNATIVICNTSIDDVRETIKQAHNISTATFFVFRNADETMSTAAKNSLLKAVEEPPNNAYFIMTVLDRHNMLNTLVSRCFWINMQPYTKKQLEGELGLDKAIVKYVKTPGLAKSLTIEDIENCEDLVLSVLECLQNKQGTKMLNCLNSLQAKKDDGKISCTLFINVFLQQFAIQMLSVKQFRKTKNIKIIYNYKKQMKSTSVNKKNCIECMLLDILGEIRND